MALKNLFDMVKADRYTADGREALIKAQEEETEDKVYQIGEISQKTGLQKTANGWVKPKNGKQPGAKKEEVKIKTNAMPKVNGPDMAVRNFESKGEKVTNWNGTKNGFLISTTKGDYQYVEKADGSFELMDRPNVTQGEALQQSIKSHGEKAESKPAAQEEIGKFYTKFKDVQEAYDAGRDTYPEGGYKIYNTPQGYKVVGNEAEKIQQRMEEAGYEVETEVPEGTKPPRYPGDAEEVKKEFDKIKAESKPAAASDIPDFKGMASEDYDKKLRSEGWTTGGWEGSGTHASAIFKKGDRTIRVNEGQPGKITSVQEISKAAPRTSVPDAAPRVLTGDTRIRVRKA